jgi:hypothetical protein
MRKVAGLALALWVLSSGAALLHVHEDGCAHEGDEDAASCSVCLTLHDVPIFGVAHPETFEAPLDVVVWISPWIALVPDEVFFDRPLARGPPSPA